MTQSGSGENPNWGVGSAFSTPPSVALTPQGFTLILPGNPDLNPASHFHLQLDDKHLPLNMIRTEQLHSVDFSQSSTSW